MPHGSLADLSIGRVRYEEAVVDLDGIYRDLGEVVANTCGRPFLKLA